MTGRWAELEDVATWTTLTMERRRAVGRALAEALGDGFAATGELVGELGFAAIEHQRSGAVLLAIPGGDLLMGLRDDEVEELQRRVFDDDGDRFYEIDWYLPQITPAHRVQIRPFLCGRELLAPEALEQLGALPRTVADEDLAFVPAQVPPVLAATGLRLLSDAEWEWIGREGGRRSWIIDVPPDAGGLELDSCDDSGENRWGIRRLKSDHGEWVADGWHRSYYGAPADSIAWDPRSSGAPGVHRGAHSFWQRDTEAVTCHAALREQAEPTLRGAVRLACDLPARG